MNPNELADELEAQNYDYWLNLMLDNVPNDIDKREGSIIYDAVAPAAMVSAQQSLSLANIIRETYIKTAQGEFWTIERLSMVLVDMQPLTQKLRLNLMMMMVIL